MGDCIVNCELCKHPAARVRRVRLILVGLSRRYSCNVFACDECRQDPKWRRKKEWLKK